MKRWIRLGVIAAVIAAMVITLVILKNNANRPAQPSSIATSTSTAESNPDRIQLLDNAQDQIAKITVVRPGSTLVLLPNGDGTFKPEYKYDVAFDGTKIRQIVSSAAMLSTRRLIGPVDSLAEYGLDNPQMTVTVDLNDGTEQSVLIGAQTPSHDGYYAKRPGDENIYSIYDTWITPFLTTLDEMRIRSVQTIDFQSLDSVEIDTLAGQTILAAKLPDWDSDPELGYTTIAVTKPFQRRFQVNTNWLQELSDALGALSIGKFVDDAPSSLAKYGLSPAKAHFKISDKDNTLEMLVGSETDGGRYAKFADSPSVFVLSGVDSIVSVTPYHAISPFALIINIDLVDRYVVSTPTATFTARIERTTVEGQKDPDVKYFLDDKEIDEKPFKTLYQWAIGLQYDAAIPAGGRPSSTDPVLSIRYVLNNGMDPLEISFIPYDANRVAGYRDGTSEFVMARSKIDRLIEAYQEATTE